MFAIINKTSTGVVHVLDTEDGAIELFKMNEIDLIRRRGIAIEDRPDWHFIYEFYREIMKRQLLGDKPWSARETYKLFSRMGSVLENFGVPKDVGHFVLQRTFLPGACFLAWIADDYGENPYKEPDYLYSISEYGISYFRDMPYRYGRVMGEPKYSSDKGCYVVSFFEGDWTRFWEYAVDSRLRVVDRKEVIIPF